jgi:hypothetical protein
LRYRSKQATAPAPQSTPAHRTPNPLLTESNGVRPQHITEVPAKRLSALPSIEECGAGFYDDDPNRGLGGSSFAKVAQ